MLSVYLCEDNIDELHYFKQLIKNFITIEDFDMKLTAACTSPFELLNAVSENSTPGLYFLDIDLSSSINGLELAVKLRERDPRGFIVFITSKNEMAPLAFRYKAEALDYLCKDEPEELSERIHHCMTAAMQRYTSSCNQIHDTITLKLSDSHFVYPKNDIFFIEMSDHPHKIRLHIQNRIIEMTATLKDIEKQLGDDFIRVHKSVLVNRKHILQLDKINCRIILDNGIVCPCSARFAKKHHSFIVPASP